MKQIICLMLAIVLVSSLTACGQQPPQTTQATTETTAPAGLTLYVGFGRTDMTPIEPLPIGDPYLGKPKLSTEILDPLLISCVAISDENNNTALIFHMDLGNIRQLELDARVPISEELGIPLENIIVASTHTHATPRFDADYEGTTAWNNAKPGLMLQAARQAVEDLKPAQMYTSSIQCENMNFIRHYVMSDGTYAGDNFGSFKNKTIVGHTEDPDNTLQLIKFVREGGKDVILANWQGHPHRANSGGGTVITSDIVGVMRATMEEEADCLFAYFTGASGNINNGSRIPGETITADYVEHGKKLAEYAQEAAKNYVLREVGPVQVISTQFDATAKHSSKTTPLPLVVLSFGDVAFAGSTIEMFNRNGMSIKSLSPFAMTFISCYTNGRDGYVPDEKTYVEYDSYEETQCQFARGTAESLELEYILLLKTLFKTAK